MSPPLEFQRVGQTDLYETPQVASSVGWAGFVVPAGTTDLPTTIPAASTLTNGFEGSYLFSVVRPKAVHSDPSRFAADAQQYVLESAGINRAAVWLENSDPVSFGPIQQYGFTFGEKSPQNYIVRKNLNADFGTNLLFFLQEAADVTVSDAGLAVERTGTTLPFIGFSKDGESVGLAVGTDSEQRVVIPFAGQSTACLTFNGSVEPQTAFAKGALDLGFNYVVKDKTTGEEEHVSYPALEIAGLPQQIPCVGAIDLSDRFNTGLPAANQADGSLRSAFAVVGDAPLDSAFRTARGRTISMHALGTDGSATSPAPAVGALALVSASASGTAPSDATSYFTPAGRFGLTADGAGAGEGRELLCGIFGSERLTFQTYDDTDQAANDVLRFLPSQAAYAPIFPFEAADLENPTSGALVDRLTATYLTSWATLENGASDVVYHAEPEGSALYGLGCNSPAASNGGPPVLVATPPTMAVPQGPAHAFPLVPYAAIESPGVDGGTLAQFASQIIAPTRKTIISHGAVDVWAAREAAALAHVETAITPTYGTTPQGLLVQLDPDSGAYLGVQLAQSQLAQSVVAAGQDQSTGSTTSTLLPFQFALPTTAVQNALQTNQLFVVAVNQTPFGNLAHGGTTIDNTNARFDNQVHMAGWTMNASVGAGVSPTNYKNVVIFKFCDGSLVDRVNNPNRWTDAPTFSQAADSGGGSLAYTGLSQWLQDYLADGIERAESGPSTAFYKNFKSIVTDEQWNGVIVLDATLPPTALPPQIRGLAAGINFDDFAAHHFGFTASRVQIDGQTGDFSVDGNSSLFGLVDYENPAYAANIAAGVGADVPIPVQTSDDFDFTVLQLQSLFENAKLALFKSHIQLTVERLFDSDVVKIYNGGQPMPANGIVLDGSYVDQGGADGKPGTPTYVFQQTTTNVLTLDSNVLPAVAFDRVQFNTLGPTNGGADVASRFLVWGKFDFTELFDRNDQLLDVLSFGSAAGTEAPDLGQTGLAFSNLIVGMTFPLATPNAKTMALDTSAMAYDSNASDARSTSLFNGFGLELKSFINAPAGKTPADFGFLPVRSTLNMRQLEGPWFGVVYEVTLGGPGHLVSAAGFSSTLLMAWSPATTPADQQQAAFVGLSLPGASPGAKLFSIEGVIKVAIGSITILRQDVPHSDPVEQFYCMRLDDIGIKILGILKLPPDANIQFFMFGDPDNTGAIGWYAAYRANESSGGSGSDDELAFAPVSEAIEAGTPAEAGAS